MKTYFEKKRKWTTWVSSWIVGKFDAFDTFSSARRKRVGSDSIDVTVSVVLPSNHLDRGAFGGLVRGTCYKLLIRDPRRGQSLSTVMTGKRPHTDSAGPFISRKYAADLLGSDIDSAGSFVEGHVRSTNPRKNLYTVDIRLDAKAKPALLDVVIEDKLQRRMGELIVGDHLRISLQGARLLPFPSDASSHVPLRLHFIEGVTILLVSRAGPQGEKEKLFNIWPVSSTHSILLHASSNPHCWRRQRQGQKAKTGPKHRLLRHWVVLYACCG